MQALCKRSDFQISDLLHSFSRQRIEHHDFVQTIQELGSELALQCFAHNVLSRLCGNSVNRSREANSRSKLFDLATSAIGSHNQNRVAEIHRRSVSICHASFVHHLEQHIKDVRMCFFDFVKQDNRVGVSTNFLCQLSAFFIPDVPRRCTYESRSREFLTILTHIDTNQGIFTAEHELGQSFDEMGFTHAGGTDEHKRTNRAIRVFQAEAVARNGTRQTLNGAILSDNLLRKGLFHPLQSNRFGLFHALSRHTTHH